MSVAQSSTGANSDTPKVVYFSSADESRFFQVSRKMADNCKLPPISKEEFAAKIKEIFNVDLNSFSGNYASLDDDKDLTIAVKDKRYIHFANSSALDGLVQDDICNYNKMILFNDKAAFAYFAATQPYIIPYLVRDYGYLGNKEWLKFAFEFFSAENDGIDLHKLLFSLENGKCTLRKNMLKKIVELGPELLYQVSEVIDVVQNEPQFHTNIEETVAYLLDATLQNEITGFSDLVIGQQPALVKTWKEHKYYNLEDLHRYVEFLYKTPEESARERDEEGDYYLLELNAGLKDKSRAHLGKIQDKDGYTNVRQYGNSKTAPVIAKILADESFYYWPLEGDWWIVEKQDGVRGFVHSSRIKEVPKRE
jgi:hypothetical protein